MSTHPWLRRSRYGIWKIVKWVVLTVVILTTSAAAAGAAYQAVGTWSDSRRFPQRGKSIQAGDIRLNIDCSGQGSPTVILESGSGVPAVGWIKVQPEVAKFSRVCSYDRAGYGWSDAGAEPRTSSQIAKELKALLDAAGEKGPYVLVGHSFGGFNVRVFTGMYPKDVAGVVLVDASSENEEERMKELFPPALIQREEMPDVWHERLEQVLTPLRMKFGVERLLVALGWNTPSYMVSKELRQELFYLEHQKKIMDAEASEGNAATESVGQVRAAGNLGSRPVIVLTAGRAYDPDLALTQSEMEIENNVWINVLQAEETHLSTRGKQIVVADSGHMIPFERPDAVVSAIHEVYDAVSGK